MFVGSSEKAQKCQICDEKKKTEPHSLQATPPVVKVGRTAVESRPTRFGFSYWYLFVPVGPRVTDARKIGGITLSNDFSHLEGNLQRPGTITEYHVSHNKLGIDLALPRRF